MKGVSLGKFPEETDFQGAGDGPLFIAPNVSAYRRRQLCVLLNTNAHETREIAYKRSFPDLYETSFYAWWRNKFWNDFFLLYSQSSFHENNFFICSWNEF